MSREPAPLPGWHEARALSFAAAQPLVPQAVDLSQSNGRVLAEDVVAEFDVAHYPSSAMDGWAVAGEAPWTLTASETLGNGQAAAVVTGGLVPAGTAGVLRAENGQVRDGILVRRDGVAADDPVAGQHIRMPGEEARRGDLVLRAGDILNPARVAVAALCGRDRMLVFPRPLVSLVLTGDEVVESGIPAPGRVRDTFGPQLPAFVELLGGKCTSAVRASDDRAATVAAINTASAAAQVVITTGGTGASSADHVRGALAELGASLVIDGIAARPGRLSLLARLPNGTFVVSLPGNPLAAMIGALALAGPLLAALGGRSAPPDAQATVGTDLVGRSGTTLVVPYRLVDGVAVPSQWSGSGMMRGLADSDGLLLVPTAGRKQGERSDAVPLPWCRS